MKNSPFKNHDWLITMVTFILMVIGLVVIYSATFTAKTPLEGAGTVSRQLVFVVLGFIVYFLVSCIDPQYYRYRPIQIVIFVLTVGLLLYVWLFGNPVRGTNRWIEWKFIRIQPSEYSKVALILLNSGILVNLLKTKVTSEVKWGKVRKKKKFSRKVKSFLKNISSFSPILFIYGIAFFISAVCVVLIFVEPAIGNATITALICASLFFITFPKQRILAGLFGVSLISANLFAKVVTFQFIYERVGISLIAGGIDIGMVVVSFILLTSLVFALRMKILPAIIAVAFGIGSFFTVSYVWENYLVYNRRIVTFLNPEQDPSGAGWQLLQSKIAIGSGRLVGKGFLQGTQSKLRYLPEAYNDFIFAAFCEEFGLVGALILFGFYVFLIVRIIIAARSAHSAYEGLICFGVAMMLSIHIFINTGMNMGVLPITGIPLPLISYGGSSVIVTMIALGFVQAVNTHKDVVDMQESFKPQDYAN